eukprot:scaffold105390_cov72-Phaeocystis_antarctica.AAC.4
MEHGATACCCSRPETRGGCILETVLTARGTQNRKPKDYRPFPKSKVRALGHEVARFAFFSRSRESVTQ